MNVLYQIWLLDPEGWDKIGSPINRQAAADEAKEWNSHGYRTRVLPQGTRPADPKQPTEWDNVT